MRQLLRQRGVYMSMRKIIAKEMAKGDRSIRLVKVSEDKRPTSKSLDNMEHKIYAQINSNEVMRSRSMRQAERRSLK